jgi:hypothetical protein
MAIQTTYGVAATAFAGMLADIGTPDIRSGINEESSSVPWGVLLKVGTVATSDDYVGLPTAADDLIAGFLIHDHAHDNRASASGSDEALAADKIGNIMRRGYFYAQPEASITVARGDPVYFRIATSGAKTQKGALSNAIDGVTNVRLPGARWAQAATNPAFAMIEVIDVGNPGDLMVGRSLANGSITADTTTFYMETPADRWLILEEAVYFNPTGLAQDATNFINIQVQDQTPTVFANWSTETGEEGSIAAATPVRLVLGASVAIPPNSKLDIFYEEGGSVTLPAGEIQITGRLL